MNLPEMSEVSSITRGDPTPINSKQPSAVTCTPKTMSSMPLSISNQNATRMLETSRSLNASLHRNKMDANAMMASNNYLLPMAADCDNTLMKAHLKQMKRDQLSREDMEICLLLFLDLDKSRKLLRAFQIIEQGWTNRQGQAQSQFRDENDPTLGRDGILQMFKCLLLSIKTCIHYDPSGSLGSDNNCGSIKALKQDKNESPQQAFNEWALSEKCKNDVQEIANYATGQVVDFVLQKQRSQSPTPVHSDPDCMQIPFHVFGEWYNAGGFSLVPWLELLDLAKWDYMGRAAATAAAAQAARGKYQGRGRSVSLTSSSHKSRNDQSSMRRNSGNYDSSNHYHHSDGLGHIPSRGGMEPIVEESFAVADVFKSPHLKASPPSHVRHHATETAPSQTHSHQRPSSPPSASPVLHHIDFGRSCHYSISITEENLCMFQELVQKTGLSQRTPDQVASVLLRHAKPLPINMHSSSRPKERHRDGVIMVLKRQDFSKCVRDMVPNGSTFSREKMDKFSKFFSIFFISFMKKHGNPAIPPDCVDAKELAVGFSFLCTGNKSSKLSATFGIMDEGNTGYLSQYRLMRYLRSHLRMLVGISLLSASPRTIVQRLNGLLSLKESPEIADLCAAADTGSNWILNNFLHKRNVNIKSRMVCFEEFASWYTEGGYHFAPWLEFIDHKKFLSQLNESQHKPQKRLSPAPQLNPPTSTGKIRSFDEFIAGSPSPRQRKDLDHTRESQSQSQGRQTSRSDPKDILFTFPLANRRNLIVLREDAAYVRLIVEQLGLLPTSPSTVWSKLLNYVKKNELEPLSHSTGKCHRSGQGVASDANQTTFVAGVLKSIPTKCKRKRSSSPLPATPQETLKNFFQSFDLAQVNRVAANQLMGGLSLLCGGNKSEKLSFAFGLFDMRAESDDKPRKKKRNDNSVKSLCGKELFYFLRSLLIVMFSCCKQSLDLTADSVGRYISDTANFVTDNAMKYQWRTRKIDRINFDEFGEWYNEGGFEIAPWLELLDLNKWVLLDKAKAEKMMKEPKSMKPLPSNNQLRDVSNVQPTPDENNDDSPKKHQLQTDFFGDCPPPPDDEQFDANSDSFLSDMGVGIGDLDLDNMDELGMDMEGMDALEMDIAISSESAKEIPKTMDQEQKPLHFRLMTNEKNNYSISISPRRVNILSNIVRDCEVANISIVTMCEQMLDAKQGSGINKERFDEAVNKIFKTNLKFSTSKTNERMLYSLLSSIFHSFDSKKNNRVEATELICGLTVLCGGRKSDKLEYTFELLDRKKKGLVSRFQMVRYLHSFLTVLLNISSCKLGDEPAEEILFTANGGKVSPNITLPRVIGWVSSWATEEVFKATPRDKKENFDGTECINFDNFAEWYTRGGHNSISWLELLDLRKWILSNL